MMEYIERELVEKMMEDAQIISDGEYCGYCTEDISISSIPAADVAPVVHGRWIYIGKYGKYECSVCHGIDTDCSDYYGSHIVTEQNFCPECGAKMDGDQDG